MPTNIEARPDGCRRQRRGWSPQRHIGGVSCRGEREPGRGREQEAFLVHGNPPISCGSTSLNPRFRRTGEKGNNQHLKPRADVFPDTCVEKATGTKKVTVSAAYRRRRGLTRTLRLRATPIELASHGYARCPRFPHRSSHNAALPTPCRPPRPNASS